jgi:hypothetical protein
MSNPFPRSIVEPFIRDFARHIPEHQLRAHVEELLADYYRTFGASGICTRFAHLAKHWRDPPLWVQSPPEAWSFPASKPAEVTLGSPNPADSERPAR